MKPSDLARFNKQWKALGEIYSSSDSSADLLNAIKYVIYDFLYTPSADKSIQQLSTCALNNRAHWMHLKMAYGRFIKEWRNLSTNIFKKILQDLLDQTNQDHSHPQVRFLYCLWYFKEMHIRNPKQTVRAETCDPATGKNYKLNTKNEKLSMLIFTPLPSDNNPSLIDPHEMDDENRLLFSYSELVGSLDNEYQVGPQFSVFVTEQWGKLARLLHNLFHLLGYLNADILFHLYDDYNLKQKKFARLISKMSREEAHAWFRSAYSECNELTRWTEMVKKYENVEDWPRVKEEFLASYMIVYMHESRKKKKRKYDKLFKEYQSKPDKEAWHCVSELYRAIGKEELFDQLREKFHNKEWKTVMDETLKVYLTALADHDWENMTSKYKKRRWNDTWRDIVGDNHCAQPLSAFKKIPTALPIVKSISQIADIYHGAQALWKEMNK